VLWGWVIGGLRGVAVQPTSKANIQIVPLAIEMQGVFNSNLESVAGDGYIGGTSGLGGDRRWETSGTRGGDQAKSETEPLGLGFDERNVGRFVFE
jgi:hypothetical protein